MFDDLIEKLGMRRYQVENILDLLAMRSLIKINRELIDSSWTKHIFAVEHFEDEIDVPEQKIDMERKDFVLNMFGRQPCFICPYTDKCSEITVEIYNPQICPWLSNWILESLEGKEYNVDFEQYLEESRD